MARGSRKRSRSFLDFLIKGIAILMIYGFISSFFENNDTEYAYIEPETEDAPTESSTLIPIGDSLSPDTMIVHKRVWYDYAYQQYSGNAHVKSSEVKKARDHKESLDIRLYNETQWGVMYKAVLAYEETNVDSVVFMLDSIKQALNLDEYEFADVIVSFVQDIPYSLILEPDCEELATRDESIRKMLDKGTPCYGNRKFGINSPPEFVASLLGDCDTRTVLLYRVMTRLGYDVAIVGSDFYSHSILGINMPGAGDFVRYRGKKYRVWETTNVGWERGVIPPDCSDLSYWEVNLANNLN